MRILTIIVFFAATSAAHGQIQPASAPGEPAVVVPPPAAPFEPDFRTGITPQGFVEPFQDSATFTSQPSPAADDDGRRIDAVEKKLNDFITKSTGTTYPNVKINGVFQADAGFFNQDADSLARFGRIQDGAQFRRARLAASGAITEVNNYFMQMDFAFFGHPTFTDVWVEQTDLPILGNVRVGQWKQPFSLEVVSSFRYTTFEERSVLFQPFTPFRHLGAGFYNRNDAQTVTWAASAFRTGQDQFGNSISFSGGWGSSERITALPYFDELSGGRHYLHLGMGHFLSAPPNHIFNFRSIPEYFVGEYGAGTVGTSGQAVPGSLNGTPFFVGNVPLANINYYNVVGTELLWVNGPFSLQSEAMMSVVDRWGASTLFLPGAYAQVGWFLTGEHRPYDRKAGAIDRVKPFENFFRVRTANGGTARGLGAWEIAGRVSHITLNDEDYRGGKLTDFTAGLNWYVNPFLKWQFNWIHALATSPASVDSNTNIFSLRVQADF